jgi:hypothetical protein
MPRYFREIEVPAGTTQAQAVEIEIEVDEPLIQDCMAFIDPGAKNLVNVELIAGEKRLFPTDGSDPFSVPAVTNVAPIQEILPSTPNILRWRAFAPQTNNDHIVLVFFDTKDTQTVGQRVEVAETGAFAPTDVSDAFESLDTVDSDST